MTSRFATANLLSEMGDALNWSILHSFADQLFNGRDLSPRQLEVVQKATNILAARKAEKEAAATLVTPEGRTTATFRIVKFKESSFRFHGGSSGVATSIKVVGVMANGVKVWGTLPESCSDAKEGDTLTVTATFTKKDEGFVTFSRPTNPVLAVA